MFPDPVVNSLAVDPHVQGKERTGIICSHCHREIIGTVHRWGNSSFDSFCWNLRFILMTADEEELKKEELRRFLSEKGVRET